MNNKCNQVECNSEAAYLAKWPTLHTLWLCRSHAAWAIKVADTLGFTLQIRTLTRRDLTEGQSGGQDSWVSEFPGAASVGESAPRASEPPQIDKSGGQDYSEVLKGGAARFADIGPKSPERLQFETTGVAPSLEDIDRRLDRLDYSGGPRLVPAAPFAFGAACDICGELVAGNARTRHLACEPRDATGTVLARGKAS